MRRSAAVIAMLALLLVSDAHADAPPILSVEDLAPGDTDVPEGWEAADGVAASGAPTEKALVALASKLKIEDGRMQARARWFRRADGTTALVTVVGIDTASDAFTDGLADEVVEHGWLARELGDPRRVSLVWSSSDDAATALGTWHAHVVVTRICELARKRVPEAVLRRDRGALNAILTWMEPAGRIEPRAAVYHALRGQIVDLLGNDDAALAAYRHVIARNPPLPAPAATQARAAGRLGHILLTKSKKELLPEALGALQRAVELESSVTIPLESFGNRYNLACAHARLGNVAEAFQELDKSLEVGRKLLGNEFQRHFEHARSKDPDLAPLRPDPRFDHIMTKYDPSPPPEKPESDDDK